VDWVEWPTKIDESKMETISGDTESMTKKVGRREIPKKEDLHEQRNAEVGKGQLQTTLSPVQKEVKKPAHGQAL